MLSLLIALAATTAVVPVADVDQNRMVALYDEICLKSFPDDAAVDRIMAEKQAKPLTPEQVKTTLNDDPGHGWIIVESGRPVFVFLELPPFHACSVRFPAGGHGLDESTYRSVADRYIADHPGFQSVPPMDRDIGPFHVHGLTQGRLLPDGSSDSLLVIDQQVIDPERRARGETGTMRRFVHQLYARTI